MYGFLAYFFGIIADQIFRSNNFFVRQLLILFRIRKNIVPKSVNYFYTRQCNYQCGFCFHTAKTSFVLPIEKAKEGLRMLKEKGMVKLNFSGGEPFIKPNYLGELIEFCKVNLELESVSIVSNGSLITRRFMRKYGKYIDLLAISCDSFDEQVNNKIGRFQNNKTNHVEKLHQIRQWCSEFEILFRINTTVNTLNLHEDFTQNIRNLRPYRWKVFQCLLIEGENIGQDALRNARDFWITNSDFEDFVMKHKNIKCLVPESNDYMKDSYLLLDEFMRFLNCQNGKKEPSLSILDVGVEKALDFSGFDEEMFISRGGIYTWSKKDAEAREALTW